MCARRQRRLRAVPQRSRERRLASSPGSSETSPRTSWRSSDLACTGAHVHAGSLLAARIERPSSPGGRATGSGPAPTLSLDGLRSSVEPTGDGDRVRPTTELALRSHIWMAPTAPLPRLRGARRGTRSEWTRTTMQRETRRASSEGLRRRERRDREHGVCSGPTGSTRGSLRLRFTGGGTLRAREPHIRHVQISLRLRRSAV